MKSIQTLAALVGLVACSTANAASLQVVMTNNNQTNAVYLLGGAENDTFNTVIFSATPTAPAQFQGISSGVGKPAGDPNTYRNRALDADPLDGGLGWSVVGTTTTAAQLGFTGGPLGGNISTAAEPGGRLFLGNVQLPAGGQGGVNVTLVNGQGAQVGAQLTAPLGVPEPATFGLAGMAMLGLAALRRRIA